METKALGIFQGDIVIRTAILMGLRELRDRPELLDYCFAWLPQDEYTAKQYGTATVEAAKRWYLNTEVNVSLDVRVGEAKLPMVSITLGDSQESDSTLGDIHYDPAEDGPEPNMVTNLESVRHNEMYTISIYVQGEPEQLLFLYSIMLFVLYRYKKDYLEGRGFEISRVNGGRMAPVEIVDRENIFGRPISISGSVRHYWPAKQGEKLTQAPEVRILVDTPEKQSPPGTDLSDPTWMLEEDVIGADKSPSPGSLPERHT